MPSRPSVVYLTPRTLAEIDDNVLAVGEAIGRSNEAYAVVDRNRARMNRLREASRRIVRRPRVSFLEWTDPLFCAGHWVPGNDRHRRRRRPLRQAGEDSVRITWDDVHEWNPEIVIVAPCGFGLAEAERLAAELPPIPGARVVPVDANAYFARPGPRYVDGIELLARIFSGAER